MADELRANRRRATEPSGPPAMLVTVARATSICIFLTIWVMLAARRLPQTTVERWAILCSLLVIPELYDRADLLEQGQSGTATSG